MNNKSLVEYKEGFISKIRRFFKRIFGKDNKQDSYIQKETIDEKNAEIKKDKFVNEIKVDTKNVDNMKEKKNFLEEINGNEEALNMLSIDRLKKLEEYYEEVIKQNNEKIKKLKQTV